MLSRLVVECLDFFLRLKGVDWSGKLAFSVDQGRCGNVSTHYDPRHQSTFGLFPLGLVRLLLVAGGPFGAKCCHQSSVWDVILYDDRVK